MAGQANAAPVIIKRKKIIAGGGHHGGAWKVAYADFVTAMMAFFMLMWLLNATTEKQRKGIADYFNPTIPVNRISGGGDGAFGGDSVLSEKTMAQNGTGAMAAVPSDDRQARGDVGQTGQQSANSDDPNFAEIQKKLTSLSGESMTMDKMMRHVVTRVSDEGLVIELFDLEDAPMFRDDSATPENITEQIAGLLVEVIQLATNDIAVNGHVKTYPVTLIANPTWDLSAARAQAMRGLLEAEGLDPIRIQRITGFADRKPATANPAAVRNNRIEVILLRSRR
jgi:chemotaxis protein MotB